MKNKIIDFLNLGNQPLANSYIKKKTYSKNRESTNWLSALTRIIN
jgi:hypothetical protein